mmetsp:Transcript_709/g.1582  ORF Transcript_709/g.1582 Transcript_709/m.1582 type:complete len:241 (+) Transcript_709:320-1042(+)
MSRSMWGWDPLHRVNVADHTRETETLSDVVTGFMVMLIGDTIMDPLLLGIVTTPDSANLEVIARRSSSERHAVSSRNRRGDAGVLGLVWDRGLWPTSFRRCARPGESRGPSKLCEKLAPALWHCTYCEKSLFKSSTSRRCTSRWNALVPDNPGIAAAATSGGTSVRNASVPSAVKALPGGCATDLVAADTECPLSTCCWASASLASILRDVRDLATSSCFNCPEASIGRSRSAPTSEMVV